jgi:putative SOS response-associated peptidase YedK
LWSFQASQGLSSRAGLLELQASEMTLVLTEARRPASAVRLSRHLSAVEGPDQERRPNVDLEVFSFLTTLPNALTQTINHERSPVLLTEEQEFSTWLTGTPEDTFNLMIRRAWRSCSRASRRRICWRRNDFDFHAAAPETPSLPSS